MAETNDNEVDCPECHGIGALACVDGCHTTECDYCDGTGYVPSDALPA